MTEAETYPFTVKEKYHSKKQITIWVVKLTQRLTREMFLELKEFAKDVDCYYSRFAKGFVFESKPSEDTLEEFAKTIDTLQEKELETMKPTTINKRPLSSDTVRNFNSWRMFQYNLNDEYEKEVNNTLIEIKERTGLDYENFTPLILEAFNKYLKALQEYFQRKSRSNVIFPNPMNTGRSNYKNLERKKQKAMRCEEIGRDNVKKKAYLLNKAIRNYKKTNEIKEGNPLSFENIQTELIRPLRKFLKTMDWTLVQSAKGKRGGMEWRMFVIKKVDGSHGWWSFNIKENGHFEFGKYSMGSKMYAEKTNSLSYILEKMKKITEKVLNEE